MCSSRYGIYINTYYLEACVGAGTNWAEFSEAVMNYDDRFGSNISHTALETDSVGGGDGG